MDALVLVPVEDGVEPEVEVDVEEVWDPVPVTLVPDPETEGDPDADGEEVPDAEGAPVDDATPVIPPVPILIGVTSALVSFKAF